MTKLIMLLLSSFIVYTATSETEKPSPPTASVQKIIGTVLFDGVAVKPGDIIDKAGLLETKEKSYIKITIEKWNNSIAMGPHSKMALNFSDEKKYTLEQGICRWQTAAKNALKENSKGKIYTKNVSMGVRGTDFLLKSFALFGETEIIMFDGSVQMDNLEDPANSVTINKGQWGGLGGRYGKKINPPLDLPANVIATFEKAVEMQ